MKIRYTLTAFALLTLTACQNDTPAYQSIEGKTMGTSYHITYQAPDHKTAQEIQQHLDELLGQVNASMSTYDPNSTISLFNALPAGQSIEIDAHFVKVLTDSQSIYEQSKGVFDPTVHPLVQLWGFGGALSVDKLQHTPDPKTLKDTQAKVGLSKVTLNGNTLSKSVDGVGLDFSAIAKGYGVDVIANALHDTYHIDNYMVEIGGEVATLGVNAQGKSWTLAVDAPIIGSTVQDRQIASTISQLPNKPLHLATSGNYRNMIEIDGVRYSHTISPTTASPVVNGTASVSVIAQSTALADGWATALSAVPFDEAVAMANKHNLVALFINPTADGKFELTPSTAYQAMYTQQNIP